MSSLGAGPAITIALVLLIANAFFVGAEFALISARRSQIEPRALGGEDTAPNPVEQVLGAFGNCLVVGYAANATVAGIELKSLRIALEGDLDLHAFLGLREGHAGFQTIKANVTIESEASAEAIRALHEKVVSTSPVGHTLSQAIPLTVELG